MPPPIPILRTNRLVLKPLELGDAPAIQALFPQWSIVRYLDAKVPWPYPADGALSYIRDIVMPTMGDGTAWHWYIRRIAAEEALIGTINLMDKGEGNRGFWLDPVWQRQGLMTEASNAVTDFWFDTLGKPILRVPKAVANSASRQISLRAGMRVVARMDKRYVSGRQPAELWEITAEEWRRFRRGSAKP